MAVSMRDVAKVAGVSQRTVSNVVNDYVYVKAETRERVREAIRRLNYRPNVSAQRLRNGRTGQVALAVPEIAAPYFAELADHLQRYAASRDITLLIEQTGGIRERELRLLERSQSSIIDGLILSPETVTAEDLADRPVDVPVVLLGESLDHSGFLHVSIDNVAAAHAATEHVISNGRSRIAAIGESLTGPHTAPGGRRVRGYLAALDAADLPVRPQLLVDTGGWTRRAGYRAVVDLLQSTSSVDGLFCFNDSLALGALKALFDHGVRVPDDIAVIGWDDIEESSFCIPTLTTVAPPKHDIAVRALDGLLAAIDGAQPAEDELTCSFELRLRGSTEGNQARPERRDRQPAPPTGL